MGKVAEKYAALKKVKKRLDALKKHPRNPRLHPEEQMIKLDHLFERFGYSKGSIVTAVDEETIIAGHAGLDTIIAQEYTHVDVIVSQLTAGEAEAFMIADNKVGEESFWDEPLLLALVGELQELDDVELEDTGFELNELDELGVPNFQPTDGEGQPRLDQKKPIICPECGHEFLTG